MDLVVPSLIEQARINQIILRVLAGFKTAEDRAYLTLLAAKLRERGAEAVILGCTELPLLLAQQDSDVELVDTLQVLAEAAIREAIKNERR